MRIRRNYVFGFGALTALFILALIAGGLPARAADLTFSDDFETGDISNWDVSFIDPGNTLEVVSGAAQSGSYGVRVTTDGSNDDANMAVMIPETNVLYTRTQFRLVTDASVGTQQIFFAAATSSQSGYVGALALRRTSSSSPSTLYSWAGSYVDSGFSFVPGGWYCIETAVTVGSGTGSMYVWVNGVPVVERQGVNTGSSPIDWIRIGADSANVVSGFEFDNLSASTTGRIGCVEEEAPPVAYGDSAATGQDVPVTIDVLANDWDPNGQAVTVAGVTSPSSGTAVANVDGTITYTPDSGFVGRDSFTYTVTDGVLTSSPATVNVEVEFAQRPNPYHAHVSTRTGNPANEATITWKTADDDPSYVRFGSAPGVYGAPVQGISLSYPDTDAGGDVCCIQAVEFNGLNPSTRYYYQVGSDADGWSVEYTFVTAPAKGSDEPFRFVALGDQPGNFEDPTTRPIEVTRSMLLDNPAFIAGLGDQWQGCQDQECVNGFYETVIADIASQAYYMAAAGNHNHYDPDDLLAWTSRNTYPGREIGEICPLTSSNGCPRNDLPELWFSFDWGNVHFTVINLDESHFKPFSGSTAMKPGEVRYEWFKNDLAAAAADPDIDWQIVLAHYTLYGSGKDEDHASDDEARTVLGPLAEQYGVDLWLAGHQASYQRTLPVADDGNSIDTGACGAAPYTFCDSPEHAIYVVAGVGGDRVENDPHSTCGDTVNCDQWVAKTVDGKFGHARVDVSGTTLHLQFVDIDGVIHDEVTITNPRGPEFDGSAPTISEQEATPSTNGATITWTTSEPATSQVAYGTTPSLGALTPVTSSLTSSHAVSISGLAPNTTYYYQPRSTDTSGNATAGSIESFTTTEGGTLALAIEQDAFVDSVGATSNYGSGPSIAMGKNSGRELRPFFEFQGLPAGVDLSKATLSLYVSNEGMEPDDKWLVRAALAAALWNEATLTWSNQPALGAALGGTEVADGGTGIWVEIDVTEAAQAAIDNGQSSLSFALLAEKVAGDNGLDELSFRSSEYPDAALRPYLTLEEGVETNTAPTADQVAVEGEQDTTFAWAPVVADADGDELTCAIADAPVNGTATVAEDCSSGTYTPNAGYVGNDSFTYIANDGIDDSASATVSATVNPVDPTILESGFETGDFSEWTNSLIESGNAVTVDAAAANTGAFGLRVDTTGSNDDAWVGASVEGTTDVYSRFRVKLVENVSSGNHQMIFSNATSATGSTVTTVAVRSASGYTNRLTYYAGGSYRYTDTYLALDTWYCVELHTKIGAGDGQAQVWVDGNLVGDAQGLNTGTTPISWVRVGADGGEVTSEYHFDDVQVDSGVRVGC